MVAQGSSAGKAVQVAQSLEASNNLLDSWGNSLLCKQLIICKHSCIAIRIYNYTTICETD